MLASPAATHYTGKECIRIFFHGHIPARLYKQEVSMAIRAKTLALLCLPALLAACEGYEWQLTDTHFPYGNQRTAGSGVAYVLVKMAPEKTLKLEPAEREMDAPAIVAPTTQVDKVLNEKLRK